MAKKPVSDWPDGSYRPSIGGIGVGHSEGAVDYYYQRGVLVVPEEALDDLLSALERKGIKPRDLERIEGTGLVQVRLQTRTRIDKLIEELGATIPVEPSYVLFPATHVRGLGARRPIPAPASTIPSVPRRGRGKNVNIGVVDLGFFDPAKAGHPSWATKGVVLDKEMPLPDPAETQPVYVGHGNAIVGILKQLAPNATVYTSTIASQRGDVPGATTDRRLGEAIECLLGRERIHILVIPFGGSTRLGTMPITESTIGPHLGSTLFVASAGNDGLDPTMYPAVDPYVVGSGAWSAKATKLGWLNKACDTVTAPARAQGLSLAKWSNSGISVHLGAPGIEVPAPFVEAKLTIKPGTEDPKGLKTEQFKGWGLFTGTSFSAAVAAGCVAGAVGGETPPTPQMLSSAVAR